MQSKTKRYAVTFFTFALVIIAGFYIYLQAEDLIRGPTVQITAPSNSAAIRNSLIEVEGEAKNISFITLNGRQIFVDEEGEFKEKLLLSEGYNIITVAAQDRFGRETKEVLELVYE